MKRMKGILKWGLALAILAGLVWAGWTFWPRSDESVQAQTSYTQVWQAARGDISASINPTGEVYAPRQARLTFDASNIPLVELNVTLGQTVKAGDVLARIETATLQGALDKAEANLLSAEEALEKAQAPYADIDIRRLEAAVVQAQVNLKAAQQSLMDLQNPDTTAAERKVREAQSSLLSARDKLAALKADTSVQENLDYLQWQYNELEVQHGQLLENPNPSEKQRDYQLLVRNLMLDAKETLERAKIQAQIDLLKAQHDVTTAEDALADAQEALAELLKGADAVSISEAQNTIAQAEYDLMKAQDDLEQALAGPDATALKSAQAKYDSARAAYENALAALDKATMIAPFDGTVTRVGAKLGDLVSPNLTVVTLADLTDLRVKASIDETKITSIEIGQPVEITFDALPGRKFNGAVLEVPLEGRLNNNVVVYDVVITLEGDSLTGLKPGMTANLKILIGQKSNVLLVPAMAVKQSAEGAVVTIQDIAGGGTSTTPVQIGLSDGTYVEIVRGLNEGDRVIVQYEQQQVQQMRFGTGGGIAVPLNGGAGGPPPEGR